MKQWSVLSLLQRYDILQVNLYVKDKIQKYFFLVFSVLYLFSENNDLCLTKTRLENKSIDV